MKKIFFIAAFLFLGAWHFNLLPGQKAKVAPQYKNMQVMVYGRDQCGLTRGVRERLKTEGVPYVYRNIDQSRYNDEMWDKIYGSKMDVPKKWLLPMVEVNGNVMLSARGDAVMEQVEELVLP